MSQVDNAISPATAYVPLRLAGRPLALKALVLVLGVAFLTASSWVQVPMWPVPMTMQTFAVLMVGALCGWRLGVATVVAWLALSIELPLLSEFKTLPLVVTTAGYIAAFPIMAAFVDAMAERGSTTRVVPTFLVLLAADILCFALGVAWLSTCPNPQDPSASIGLSNAIAWGLTPFALGDLIKIALATAVLTGARRMKQR